MKEKIIGYRKDWYSLDTDGVYISSRWIKETYKDGCYMYWVDTLDSTYEVIGEQIDDDGVKWYKIGECFEQHYEITVDDDDLPF